MLAASSGLLFGTALGFPVSVAAATLGASCAFLIARRVGLGAVEQLAGPRVQRVRGWIGRRGFVAVLYARIIPGMPFAVVNYAAGLTPLRLPVFAAATALGAAPRAFAYTALGGSFGNWRSPETLVAVIGAGGDGGGRPRAAAARGQTSWICSRLVVPGFPDGRPAVIPTRSPGLTQPSSTTRAAAAWTRSSVTS